MFYEPTTIDAWFPIDNDRELDVLKCDLLERDDLLENLLKLWKLPHVAKGYAKETQKNEWVKKMISNTGTKYSVLERVARRLAECYFTRSTLQPKAFLWIPYGFMVKVRPSHYIRDMQLTSTDSKLARYLMRARPLLRKKSIVSLNGSNLRSLRLTITCELFALGGPT